MTFKLTKNQMLIEAVEHYIYSMQKVNANQAAIDVYTELLNQLEAEEEEQEEIRRQKTGIGYVNGILVVDEF